MSPQSNLEFVPTSLQCLFGQLINSKDFKITIASLGQAVIQAALPRGIISPLQIGLDVQLHHHFGSKFLIDTLNSLGFCFSYAEVQRYEKSAAASETPLLITEKDQFVQFAADNVDHNTGTIDGHNTFNGMGIIATITPKIDHLMIIPRRDFALEELVQLGKIKQNKEVDLIHVIHQLPDEALYPDDHLDILLTVSRQLRSVTPGWAGVMQGFQDGAYPGQSDVVFLSMIDMNPSDMACIYSTLKYVSGLAEKNHITSVVTFN